MRTDLRDLFPQTRGMDEKSLNALLRALKNNFDEGEFDYLRFKQSVNSLMEMEMSEEMAVKSAFTTASTLGLTKDKLLNSAKKYVYALEDERESFSKAVLSQIEKNIDGRKAEVKQLANKIEEHKLRIKELEREIAIFQSKIDNVDQDVEKAEKKIEATKSKFVKVYDSLNASIQSDMERIQKFL